MRQSAERALLLWHPVHPAEDQQTLLLLVSKSSSGVIETIVDAIQRDISVSIPPAKLSNIKGRMLQLTIQAPSDAQQLPPNA
jgi:hypothetical protein